MADIFDEVAGGDATFTKTAVPEDKGILANAARAVKESVTQQSIRDLINEKIFGGEPGTAGKIGREVALAPLEAAGTLFAPAAGLGSIAGDLTRQGLSSVMPQSLSSDFDPTGSQSQILNAIPNVAGTAVDMATQMALPTGIATGGASSILKQLAASRLAKQAGGATGILSTATADLTKMADLESAGATLHSAQQSASAAAREIASQKIEAALKLVPKDETIPNSVSNEIRQLVPSIGALTGTAQRKLDKLAVELEDIASVGEKTKVGGMPLSQATPEFRNAVLASLGYDPLAPLGKEVSLRELDQRRQSLSSLYGLTRNDADRRLYRLTLDAVNSDIQKFATKYPEAIQGYRDGLKYFKEEVAQFHSHGAPLRDLVDKNNPSVTIDKLQALDIEDIRNSITGLSKGPNGAKALEEIRNGVMQSIIQNASDPSTGSFLVDKFLATTGDQSTVKLQTLLGPRYKELARFRQALTDANAAAVKQVSNSQKAGTTLKYMGAYHLLRGTEQIAIGSPFAFYHLASAATMFLAPKLFMRIAQNKVGANLLAAGALVGPGTPEAAGIAKALEVVARGVGGREVRSIPAVISAVKNEEKRIATQEMQRASDKAMKSPQVSLDKKIAIQNQLNQLRK